MQAEHTALAHTPQLQLHLLSRRLVVRIAAYVLPLAGGSARLLLLLLAVREKRLVETAIEVQTCARGAKRGKQTTQG